MSESKKIGALWTKHGKSGQDFYTGSIELDGKQTRIVVWPTREKKTEKSPDFTIQLDTWEPGQGRQEQSKPAPQAEPAAFNDDIPF